MAEGLLRHRLDERGCSGITVTSSGTWASDGNHATPEAIVALQGRGIDLSPHRAQAFDPAIDADLIVAMTSVHLDEISRANAALGGRVRLMKELVEIDADLSAGSPHEKLESLLAGPRPESRRAHDLGDPYGLPFSAYERTLVDLDEGIEVLLRVLCPGDN